LDKVNLLEIFEACRVKYVKDRNNIFMIEVTKQFDLTQGTETEHGVVKRGYPFDGDFTLG
jgi:hypothetical protein